MNGWSKNEFTRDHETFFGYNCTREDFVIFPSAVISKKKSRDPEGIHFYQPFIISRGGSAIFVNF